MKMCCCVMLSFFLARRVDVTLNEKMKENEMKSLRNKIFNRFGRKITGHHEDGGPSGE